MIIAFSGIKFAGKDTAAEALIRGYGFKRIGLADKLKDICSVVFDIQRRDMDSPSKKEIPFDVPVLITSYHINHLLTILQDDKFEFNFTEKYEILCEKFAEKSITSIRDMLQFIGTDVCRNYIKDDIWLSYVQACVEAHVGNVVITDARFENERAFLKSLGAILILVKRPGNDSKSDHISENQLGNDDEYDVIVWNDGTVSSLQSSICLWYSLKKDAIKSMYRKGK